MNDREPSIRTRDWSAPPALDRVGNLGLAVGVVGAVLLVLGFLDNQDLFYRAYLVGWTTWLSIALGSLALSMVHHLSGGSWGLPIRRIWRRRRGPSCPSAYCSCRSCSASATSTRGRSRAGWRATMCSSTGLRT